ncbi:hypothetical protein DENSPDRAFT_787504, partial [Dentipellis sp. KUC8613]
MRDFPNHECHAQFHEARQEYRTKIHHEKNQHWRDWLDNASDPDIWTANRYISCPSTDGGKTRIPSLSVVQPDGTVQSITDNNRKSEVLARAFFPPPPPTSSIDPNFVYPTPLQNPGVITTDQIRRHASKLSPYKASGPDGIPNIVLTRCIEQIINYLYYIFEATFALNVYYDPWREFTTVVLRKPNKPRYDLAKAYRPIALLNTTCKLL